MKPEPFCKTVKKRDLDIPKRSWSILDEDFDGSPEETEEYLKDYCRQTDTNEWT